MEPVAAVIDTFSGNQKVNKLNKELPSLSQNNNSQSNFLGVENLSQRSGSSKGRMRVSHSKKSIENETLSQSNSRLVSALKLYNNRTLRRI